MRPLKPRNKEIEHILDRLSKYPVVKVDPQLAQSFSRYKDIRYINSGKPKKIYIAKGIIGLSPRLKIKKNGDNFIFEIK